MLQLGQNFLMRKLPSDGAASLALSNCWREVLYPLHLAQQKLSMIALESDLIDSTLRYGIHGIEKL
ncbi:hypothetical protein OIDMADRAFT_19504 [Oidiodendron maius Zn]|uniref:Uncharacterized protein n=1 Tax=Oidiodendron maius (strain Zn) TaxID=913774 RepID=A0A0C3CN22_OIDMZ|nr:hypothetical protein OIDMADRAFT_19504 [Oidiodendron maius Zn]